MNKLYFSKVNENAIIPTKRVEDAGYDLYPCFEEGEILIAPGGIALIPTGIATAFNDNYALIVKERGSTGSKGMSVRMGVVDSGYRGEIRVAINNTGRKIIILQRYINEIYETDAVIYYPYSKAIAQAVMIVLPQLETEEIPYEKLLEFTSERMFQSLGGSGK